jgi:hypothetical protein
MYHEMDVGYLLVNEILISMLIDYICMLRICCKPIILITFNLFKTCLKVIKVNCCRLIVTLDFKDKLNTHSMCAQESSLHTYHTENGYRIINVTIYNIYYRLISSTRD